MENYAITTTLVVPYASSFEVYASHSLHQTHARPDLEVPALERTSR